MLLCYDFIRLFVVLSILIFIVNYKLKAILQQIRDLLQITLQLIPARVIFVKKQFFKYFLLQIQINITIKRKNAFRDTKY